MGELDGAVGAMLAPGGRERGGVNEYHNYEARLGGGKGYLGSLRWWDVGLLLSSGGFEGEGRAQRGKGQGASGTSGGWRSSQSRIWASRLLNGIVSSCFCRDWWGIKGAG